MKGVSIAFIGTDGAGKSTVIELVTPRLKAFAEDGVIYKHMRPNWLPALGSVGKKGGGETVGSVTDPHGRPPSGLLGSLARLTYYWLDYTLGYWIITYPCLAKSKRICLFDRYFYDIIIDPARMRIDLPKFLLKWVFLFVPKPDIIICLGAEPEVLYARKPETSLEEVTRQVHELRQMAEKVNNAVWVDTAQGIEETVDEVFEAVEAIFALRC